MKYFYKILFLTLLLVSNYSFSQQVEVLISNVTVDDVPIQESTVQMGTNSKVRLKFRVVITKPSNLTVGRSRVHIGTYKSNGQFIQALPYEDIDLGAGSTGVNANREFELFASVLDFDGNCYLSVDVQQLDYPSLNWFSNKIYLKKTPTSLYQVILQV
jgi:hypothetical protein